MISAATKKHQANKITIANVATWYQEDYVVFATRDSFQLANDGALSVSNILRWSEDNGETWVRSYAWGTQFSGSLPVYNRNIKFAHIFEDGTILFGTSNKLYTSTDRLQTITEVSTNYTIHTPATATLPGAYFQSLHKDEYSTLSNGNEIVVWSNYCNLADVGASAILVWYAINNNGTVTVKKVYEFGQNPDIRDDGTSDGGSSGTLLGDAANANIVRHGHCVTRRPGTLEWYACFGDLGTENKWTKHIYDENADTWTNTILFSKSSDTLKWKSTGLYFVNDTAYWHSDATGGPALTEVGVFKCPIANLGDDNFVTRVIDSEILEGVDLKIDSHGNMVGTIYANFNKDYDAKKVIVAKNYGAKYYVLIVPEASNAAKQYQIYPKDSRGYYSWVIGYVHQDKAATMFLKFN